jgi:hypothetical protein
MATHVDGIVWRTEPWLNVACVQTPVAHLVDEISIFAMLVRCDDDRREWRGGPFLPVNKEAHWSQELKALWSALQGGNALSPCPRVF